MLLWNIANNDKIFKLYVRKYLPNIHPYINTSDGDLDGNCMMPCTHKVTTQCNAKQNRTHMRIYSAAENLCSCTFCCTIHTEKQRKHYKNTNFNKQVRSSTLEKVLCAAHMHIQILMYDIDTYMYYLYLNFVFVQCIAKMSMRNYVYCIAHTLN